MKLKVVFPLFWGAPAGALAKTKARLSQENHGLQPALAALLQRADAALKDAPPHVTQKTKRIPGAKPNDYVSLAPYFWPDPSKPDGLPYLRRDGQVNPETRSAEYTDLRRLERLAQSVEALTLAFYFTGKSAYGEKATHYLKVWFLDPTTRMNPHLDFGQGVPGESTGRPAGVIEGGNLVTAIDCAGLLMGAPGWGENEATALKAWAKQYLTWLRTSKMGQGEGASKQNHGTLYDGQVVRLALVVGDKKLAKEVCEAVKEKRITVQILPDGSQPLELTRTKALSYSRLNLLGLMHLAMLAESVGVDLWRFESPRGGSIRKALDFLVPYLQTPPKKWPYEQITKVAIDDFSPLLRQASQVYKESAYEQLFKESPAARAQLFHLLHPSN